MNQANRHRHGKAWESLPDKRATYYGWPYVVLILAWVAIFAALWWLA
jgi:hypothetical protein